MFSHTSATVIGVLLLIIGGLSWMVFAKPAEAPTVSEGTHVTDAPVKDATPTAAAPAKPLSSRVTITYPKKNQSVSKKFTVTGTAPGNWFFEASAPIQIRDSENSKIFQGIAKPEGDWMTTKLVPFTAEISIAHYSGPATLVFLKDNPSGLPENDDSVEVPIVIQ